MGMSIQFESDRVEFWAIYGMERDEDVLEFYDQSSRIPLSYRAKSGRRTTQWHTPDFFVLRRESAGWEEWKQEDALDPLAESQPARYQRAETGQWHCPPGETYAEHLGLTYRLRSSAEFHPLEIQNLKFLQDFWAHEVPPPLSLNKHENASIRKVDDLVTGAHAQIPTRACGIRSPPGSLLIPNGLGSTSSRSCSVSILDVFDRPRSGRCRGDFRSYERASWSPLMTNGARTSSMDSPLPLPCEPRSLQRFPSTQRGREPCIAMRSLPPSL